MVGWGDWGWWLRSCASFARFIGKCSPILDLSVDLERERRPTTEEVRS
jgi:hypothetical protein